MSLRPLSILWLPISLAVLLLAGCSEQVPIREYTVPKQRTMAAIVPHEANVWFFKLTGPVDAVESVSDEFTGFVQTVRFSQKGEPQWNLPEGWQELPQDEIPADSMVKPFAVVKLHGDQVPLELTVTTLPAPSGSMQPYVLANVNRWREQLGLDPVETGQLEEEAKTYELAEGKKATVVDLVGRSELVIAELPGTTPAASSAAASGPAPLEYKVPEGWQKARQDAISLAAFEVQKGDQKVRTTVSALGAAAGDLLPNINRWRGQLKLEPWTEAQLQEAVEPIQVDDVEGHYVQLEAPESATGRQAILGVIAVHGNESWFFKLMGDLELARAERANFRQFVESVKFAHH